jgi:radical SAM protein with 4Fe4S-binding SPASM domain
MDQRLYEMLVSELRNEGVKELGLFYLGESFLCPWLPEAVHFAKTIGFPYVFLTTNGSLCTESKLKAVMGAGLDSLKFSFNYADEEQFKEIANVNSKNFKNAVKAVKLAYRARAVYGYKTKLYASYIKYDGEQAEKMKPILEEIKPYVDEIYALPLYDQGSYVNVKGIGKKTPGNVGRADNMVDPLPCWAGFKEGHITYDGKLAYCCFSHDDRFHIGDLKTTGFMQAWNSEKAKKLRRAHLDRDVSGTECERCVILD